jgi:hypothetical protein
MVLSWATIGGQKPLYYIPITLTNNQSQTTAVNLPVKIPINSNTNSSKYQAALLNVNWQDGAGNIFKSWLESGETNISTASVYWVNLGANTIAGSGGSLIIYQVIYDTAVTAMDGSNTGAEPNYTGTYAQYDNGTSVFTEYWNFAGISLPAGWTSAYGAIAPVVNNGLTISNNMGGSVYRTAATAYNSAGYIFETKMKDTDDSNQATGGFTIANTQALQGGNAGANALVLYCCNAPSYVYYGWAADGSTTGYNIFSGVSLFTIVVNTFWIASIVCGDATTNKVNLYKDYGSVKSSSGYIHSTMYIILGLKAGVNADSNTTHQWVYQWIRTRLDPPNDTMPSQATGSLTPLPQTYTITDNIDVQLQRLGLTQNNEIDVNLKRLDITTLEQVDVELKASLTIPESIDTNLLGAPKIVYDIDALFEKLGITKNDSVDTLIEKLNTNQMNNVDVIIKGIQYNVDTAFLLFGQKTGNLIDVILDAFHLKGRMNAVKESLMNKITTYGSLTSYNLVVIDSWRMQMYNFNAFNGNLVSVKIMPSMMQRLNFGSMITNQYFGQYYAYKFTLHVLASYLNQSTYPEPIPNLEGKTAMDIANGLINYLRINQSDPIKGVLSITDITARESDPAGLTRGGAHMARIIIEGIAFAERPYKHKYEVV